VGFWTLDRFSDIILVVAIKGRRATYEERVSACEALENGIPADDVAKVLKVSRASIFEWQKTYRARGPEALRTKKTRGPRSKLDDGQMSQLYRLIVGNDPRQLSFGLALWTRGMIQELIFRQFGIRLSVVSVGNVLGKLGMSPQRPLYRAYEQDPEKVAEWKEKTFPQIQARAKKEGAAIFFADEASVRTNYHAGTTWAPVGKTPVVSGSGRTRSISMVSAISPRGELHFQVYETGIRQEEFLDFCKMLVADAGRPVFLIMDNSQVHRARILKAHAEQSNGMLTLFFLPPYSPDLNPDEWVWKNVKHDNLGRASVKSEGELAKFATTALASLKKMPEKLRSFFGDPALRYIRDLTAGVQKLISALDHGTIPSGGCLPHGRAGMPRASVP
jgi:transposase